MNSVYAAADEKKVTLLVGLDLSAAFDTINHDVLISQSRKSRKPVWRWRRCFLLAALVPQRQATVRESRRSFTYRGTVHLWSSPRVSARTTALHSIRVAGRRAHRVSWRLLSSVCWRHAAARRHERHWRWTGSRKSAKCSTAVWLWFCITTYSSTETSLRSSFLALHSGPLLISAKSRSPAAGCRLRQRWSHSA